MNTILNIPTTTFPLTQNQMALWLDQMLLEDKAIYNIGGAVEIKKDIQITAFIKAMQKVVAETDALGISIQKVAEMPTQTITGQLDYQLPILDFSKKSQPEHYCRQWITQQLDIPFNLQQPPLYEFTLVKVDEAHFFLMLKFHHLVMDGWGGALFVEKLDKYYQHFAYGAPSPNGQLPPQFKDYIKFENTYLQTEEHQIDRDYWVEKFQQIPSLLLEKQRTAANSLKNEEAVWLIPSSLQLQIEQTAKSLNTSLAQFWIAILSTYFYRISQKETLCFGLPITNRYTEQEGKTIGLFTGVIPTLLSPSEDATFLELLAHIKQTRRKDRPHQRFSLGELMSELRQTANISQPLFDISINFDNIICELENLDSELVWWKRGAERKTPMTFFIKPYRKGNQWELKATFLPEYCTAISGERMMQRLSTLIEDIVNNPNQKLSSFELLPALEQQLVLKDFNNTQADFPNDTTIIDLFEAQVAKTPDNVAVAFENQALSYQDLNDKANQVAHYLVTQYQIQLDDIIGLQVARSEWMIVGILGILKAGAAYLPMGPDLPQARVAFMLEDSAAKVLLTDESSQKIAATFSDIVPVLNLNKIIQNHATTPISQPTVSCQPSNLAYIIYTSGSTGKPKGVMIEHRNVVRLMVNNRPLFDFNKNDVWTLFHYYGFDFSVWEIWGALLFGGKLIVVPKAATLNPEAFADLLIQEQVTVLNQVPSTFDQVQTHLLKKAGTHSNIRYIIFGGAKLQPSTLRAWNNRFPKTQLINMYGITETTVHVTYKEIGETEIETGISNIGSAIPTLRCYILDPNLRPVPIGVTGEIYVAGDGLARGYLNNPVLTAERFIQNPFETGQRLYKSGDSGRWLENGDIEFFGRIDFQLKIRGFRIEAGEIEQQLLTHPSIQSAIVLGKDINHTTELVAYLTGEDLPSIETLRAYLGESLPTYMIPAYFVQMEVFPLTKNGKVDRKALPEPDGLSLTSGVTLVAPRNATETAIVNAFANILNIDASEISIYDDFFNLGGDSIKLIRLVAQIQEQLGIQLALAKVYAASQVVNLADYLLENREQLTTEQSNFVSQKQVLVQEFQELKNTFISTTKPKLTHHKIVDVFPMSDIQRGMVFGNLLYENQGVYHDQAVYALGHIGFEKTRFEQAVRLMIEKHATLRTAFHLNENGQDIQLVYGTIDLPLTYHETQTFHADELRIALGDFLQSERRKGFDIQQPGLWRIKVFQSDTSHPLLVLQFHHAIFDGWSLASFNTELLKIYHELQTNSNYRPAQLSLTYKDFVIREQLTKQDQAIQTFWQNELANYERLDLFIDSTTIDDEYELGLGTYLQHIEALAEQYEVSVKILTLSAYLLLLDFLTSQSDLVIGTISTNRMPEAEGDQLLGCFLNSVPLRTKVNKQNSVADFIKSVDQKIKSLRGKDQMTTMEIAKILGENSADGNPIFDVIFNYIDFHIYEDLDDIGLGAQKMLQADISDIPDFFERTNTYFDLMVNTTGGELMLKVQLSKKLKAHYTAKEVLYKFIGVLDSLRLQPEAKIRQLSLLNEQERNRFLFDFNDTAVEYAPDKTVMDLFEEQAAKTPDRIALVFEDSKITYRELEKRSRQLAHYLREQGVKTDTMVGLCMHRSIEMMVSIYGILRAGGAYVPLDPEYPKDRVIYMLQDGIVKGNAADAAKIIITQKDLEATVKDNMGDLDIQLIALSADWNNNLNIANTNPVLTHKPSPEDLIYVIFTSGSTGKPKGTLVKHQGFFNLVHWYINDFDFNENSKFLLVSSINFDLTQKNLYAPLVLGGSLHMSQAENYDLVTITDIIHKDEITTINCTPSIFYGFVEQAEVQHYEQLKSLTYVFLGGEPINLLKLRPWYHNPYNQAKLVNSYGPTECSDVVSYYVLEDSNIPTIPIGIPICNTQLYVLDAALNLVPPGVQGELCIGGKGIGRGYLNNPELTQQKFIPNPFTSGELLYKTGDMATWLPDGNIEFLGRADHQLKIRGYRIETGEIEEVLFQHPAIHAVVVMGKDIGDNKELVAYLVPTEDSLPSLEVLRNHLAEQLPNYMIPSYFIQLTTLPLTPSGKVNRRALPEPEENGLASEVNYVAPRTRTEAILSRIWENILGRTKIGVFDNFFDLGGHSLRVVRLVSLVQQELSVAIKLSEVFATPTIAALAAQIAGKTKMQVAAIEPIPVQAHYALSNAQRRLWVLDQMDDNQIAYNMPMVIQLEGPLDTKALRIAFERLVARHESLRTNIVTIDGNPRQIINEVGQFKLLESQWQAQQEADLKAYILKFAQRPFDLATDALLRLELLQLAKEKYVLLFNMHHIVSDGWSMEILLQELGQLYHAEVEETASGLPDLTIQYKDYAAWQNGLLEESELMEDLRNYWHQKLAPTEEGIPILDLPTDFARPAIQTFEGAIISKTVSPALLEGLEKLSQASGVTLYMTLTTLVKVFLYRYTGQRDILLGSLSAGRVHPDLEQQIGFYINTLVLRDYVAEGTNFADFLQQVKQTSLEAIDHELYPFDRLVEELNLVRDVSRSPLFDVLIAIQSEESKPLNFGEVAVAIEHTDWGVSKYDLSFGFTPTKKGLQIDIEYNTNLYKTERIQRMFGQLETLIASILANSEQNINHLDLLPKAEKDLILNEFSFIPADYDLNKTIHQLFEEQVAKTPDNVAVIFEEKQLTYRELNAKANQLAHYLRQHFNIKGDDIVALQVERSDWMMVALYGVLKSGAAYLPIATDYPENRTRFLLEDSGAKILLTNENLLENAKVFENHLPVVALETAQADKVNNPATIIDSDNLSYIIYTSGSTGQPKGVLLQHRGVVNMLYGQLERLEVTAEDSALQFAPYTFDASVGELFLGLSVGAMMVVASRETLLSTDAFQDLMHRHQITIADVPPTYLSVLDEAALANARLLITAGEAAISEDVKKYTDKLQYVNIYGPTETTVVVTNFKIPASYELGQSVPIGRPVPNMEILIVDEHLQLVPIGVPGEIVVSGVGLARGYVNNPELTAKKFVPHPFKKGERLYKTGDLGLWLADGNIEFIGRVDHQLKIKGYRIEAGEIEDTLLQHPAIQSCVVVGKVLKGAKTKELIAYFVTKNGKELAVADLRNHLGESLPDYMIPTYFVQLEALPLTSHDKVNRKALPEPDSSSRNSGIAYVAPQSKMEVLLAEIWQEVLRQQDIGIHDNFFYIGGDSIKALQISSRLGAKGWTLSIKDLFTQPTIAQLALKIKAKKRTYPQTLVNGQAPLTAIQKWFFETIKVENQQHFNQAFRLSAKEAIETKYLKESLSAIVQQHDILRAIYHQTAEGIAQIIQAEISLDFQEVEIKDKSQETALIAKHIQLAQSSFDLAKGPLLKAILFKKSTGDELFIVIHHLVVDGVSWRILLEDLNTAYSQLAAGQAIALAPKTAPFAWWSEKINTHANSSTALGQLDYWNKVLAQNVEAIPVEYPNGSNQVGNSMEVDFQLNQQQTQQLLQQTNQAYKTAINDVLLCALSRALEQTFGGTAYQITLEGHGRETLADMDISRTVGWFTSMFPVVLNYKKDLAYHLQSTKENLHRIPNKGMDYGLLRYLNEEHKVSDNLKVSDTAAISFNYLGSFSEEDNNALFAFSNKNTGDNISPNMERDSELDVLGILMDGRLNMSIAFSDKRIKQTKIKALAANYKRALLDLITHCVQQESSQLSPVDYTACDLTLEQYQYFLTTNQLAAADIEDIYTLSPLQEGMLFHKLLNPDSLAYFNQLDLHLSADLDVAHFKKCWEAIVQAHPVLRTSFYSEGLPAPLQVVHQAVHLDFISQNISHHSPSEQGQILETYLEKDKQQGFDLSEKSLLRLALFQTAKQQYRLVVSGHHISIDGWSLAIILQDLKALYQKEKQQLELKPYAPYIAWLNEQSTAESESFWRNYLAAYEETATVPGLKTDKTSATLETENLVLKLSKTQTADLEQLAKKCQVSLNTLIQGIWAVILGVYNQKEEVVFGMTTSGRSAPIKNIETSTGLFINTIPVRIALQAEQSFAALLHDIQQSAIAAQEYEHYSLAFIQSLWQGEGELFDHIMVFENYPVEEKQASTEKTLNITAATGYESTHYGFGLVVGLGEELEIRLTYNKVLLNTAQVERVRSHIAKTIETVLQHPQQAVGQINILPQDEWQSVLYEFNDTDADFPKDKTIVDLFEMQAAKTPNRIAVTFEQQTLTYAALNEKANKIAYYLQQEHQVQADDIIGLQVERSEWIVIGILGILKAGAAYLPMGADLPEARVAFMLKDSAAKLLLSDDHGYEVSKKYQTILPIKSLTKILENYATTSLLQPTRRCQADHLAYIIYTSGSTGQPKGVMIEHRNVVRLMKNDRALFDFNEKDVWTLFHYYGFDFSVWEIWGALLFGGKVVVVSKSTALNPQAFANLVHQEKVTVLNQVPSTFEQVQVHLLQKENLAIRYLIFGGAKLQPAVLQNWKKQFPATRLINMYGITETTVHVTYKEIEAADIERGISNIGTPIPTLRCYILDPQLKPVPIGVIGEIYVAGDGLARAYLHQPDLTDSRFVENPLVKGERLYKSGDSGRWLANGEIEFFGRIDFQLKIRGFRIEAGEIEQQLLQHPLVQSALVLGKTIHHKTELVAYLTGDNLPSIEALRTHLEKALPAYMIPSYFIKLEKIPLTINGKVNRKALPEPNNNGLVAGTKYVAARNELEQQLVEIWEAVLNHKKISVKDNFFHLGGHSLNAIRLLSKIQEQLTLPVPLQLIFQHPTLEAQAAQLQTWSQQSSQAVVPEGVRFNPTAKQTLFTFPPFFGLSIWYQQLAKQLPDISFYCFDFLLEDHRLDIYYQQIKKEQPEGPYTLFGYSAGGSLAYEMAAFMESKGDTVAAVVMGDSMLVKDMKTDMEGYLNDLAAALNTRQDDSARGLLELLHNKVLREQSKQRLVAYENFLNNVSNHAIRADIHLIKAAFESPIPGMHQRWSAYTTGTCTVHQASGSHDYLFEQPHLVNNANILKAVFKQQVVDTINV